MIGKDPGVRNLCTEQHGPGALGLHHIVNWLWQQHFASWRGLAGLQQALMFASLAVSVATPS
jgi:hypothetical protein